MQLATGTNNYLSAVTSIFINPTGFIISFAMLWMTVDQPFSDLAKLYGFVFVLIPIFWEFLFGKGIPYLLTRFLGLNAPELASVRPPGVTAAQWREQKRMNRRARRSARQWKQTGTWTVNLLKGARGMVRDPPSLKRFLYELFSYVRWPFPSIAAASTFGVIWKRLSEVIRDPATVIDNALDPMDRELLQHMRAVAPVRAWLGVNEAMAWRIPSSLVSRKRFTMALPPVPEEKEEEEEEPAGAWLTNALDEENEPAARRLWTTRRPAVFDHEADIRARAAILALGKPLA